jgi:pantoate--beta-alanine ligase
MQTRARKWRRQGKKVVLVPTMGALHNGHLALIKRGRRLGDKLVVSIFVNPSQFGPREDYSRYPRTFSVDKQKCLAGGADVVFCPDHEAMYPPGFDTWVNAEVLTSLLEGEARPTHFRGVATVVLKLFNIISPDIAIFGQKDYQQTAVLRRMVDDLNVPVKIVVGPTVREPDGLALSSRNVYLSPEQRRTAGVLYRSLTWARSQIEDGKEKPAWLAAQMRKIIHQESDFQVEYIEFADPETLKKQRIIKPPTVILLAARINQTRFIDNVIIK